jgi:hypothetical protein
MPYVAYYENKDDYVFGYVHRKNTSAYGGRIASSMVDVWMSIIFQARGPDENDKIEQINLRGHRDANIKKHKGEMWTIGAANVYDNFDDAMKAAKVKSIVWVEDQKREAIAAVFD